MRSLIATQVTKVASIMRCVACDYDLRGIRVGTADSMIRVCPECGQTNHLMACPRLIG